jgi:hypothetical protein
MDRNYRHEERLPKKAIGCLPKLYRDRSGSIRQTSKAFSYFFHYPSTAITHECGKPNW